MRQTLLIELLTEELPPKLLSRIGETFANGVLSALKEQNFLAADSRMTPFATPRRLAVSITQVAAEQPEKQVERKGPAVASGLDAEGRATPALAGFARSCGVEVAQLERAADAKGNAYFVHRYTQAGNRLADAMIDILTALMPKLPVAKVMRWGSGEAQFVRPVHGFFMLHGETLLKNDKPLLGLHSEAAVTRGHRFLGKETVRIPHADEYATVLERDAHVVANFEARRSRIRAALEARAEGATILLDEALLDEVTSLVEWPEVYAGTFSAEFLKVPQECLILSMKQHQKYFALVDGNGKLLPRFLVVSNMKTADPTNIVAGNQRVLRARLSDAKFFFETDLKAPLASRVPQLQSVVYHNKLGSQLERVQRIQKLSGAIAAKLGADVEQAERAGYLAKADLLTGMVGEFPELQGIMGMYYARHDGEAEAVAKAIEAHYHPRFAGDSLPEDNVGACAALADKLDTLVGIYGIGQVPTGDKDPFALRRAALGVLRILSEKALPLDLRGLLDLARAQFPDEVIADSVAVDVHAFMLERLKNYLRDRGYAVDEVDAVVSQNPSRIDRVVPRIEAVRTFRRLPEAESLAAANKRIQNILKKTQVPNAKADPTLLQEAAEKALFEAVNRLTPSVGSLVENEDYTGALTLLANVRKEVDTFFDEVMVMTDEPLVRDNRLALLKQLAELMNRVADIAKLAA